MNSFWKKEETDEIICLCHFETPISFKTEVKKSFSLKKFRFEKTLYIRKTTICKNCNSVYITKLSSTNFDKEISINALVNELLPLINRAWSNCDYSAEGPQIKFKKTKDNNPSAPPAEEDC